MFGLEILDVVIGLMLVYLLLALFATALNEYVAAVLNLRGKELAKGLGRLLDDVDEGDALQNAWRGVGTRVTTTAESLTEQLYNHRLIRPFATRQGWMTRVWRRLRGTEGNPRLPSYIPARTFALALLDVLGIDEKDAGLERLIPSGIPAAATVDDARRALGDAEAAAASNPAEPAAAKRVTEARWNLERATLAKAVADAETRATSAAQAQPADAKALAGARARLTQAKLAQALAHAKHTLAGAQDAHDAAAKENKPQAAKAAAAARQVLAKVEIAKVLAILKQESPIELTEHLEVLAGLPQADKLAGALQVQVAGLVAGAQTRLQNLHDGVEVWFNNAMDRVSGAYKRTAQGWLFALGLLIAACMNADTIDMWRRLQADDELRAAMVRRAEAAVTAVDSTAADSLANPTPAGTSSDTSSVSSARLPAGSRTVSLAAFQVPPRTPEDTIPGDTAAADSAQPAAGAVPAGQDSAVTRADSAAASVKAARENYQAARARLDSMELRLGWTTGQLVEARLLRRDTAGYPTAGGGIRRAVTWLERRWAPKGHHVDFFPFDTGPTWLKAIGLLLTALAISLGAPFWFDLLNKVISIRSAGRSPAEKPKSPEGGPKRMAEQTPK